MATSVFRVVGRSVYFSPKCEGVFIVSSWVTASGHVDGWCVFTVSIFRAKPWMQTQRNLTEWAPVCVMCGDREASGIQKRV